MTDAYTSKEPMCVGLCTTHRYTGFVRGMQETYKKTPFMAQLETKQPTPDTLLHTRAYSPPKSTYHSMQRDPCNHPEELHKHTEQGNLWPCLQERAAQVSVAGHTHRMPHTTAPYGDALHVDQLHS